MENDREKYLQEEILNALRKGDRPDMHSNDDDTAAYLLLFDALSEKAAVKIPQDFAEVVAKKAVRKKKISDAVQTAWMYVLPITVMLLLSASSLFFFAKETFEALIRFGRLYGHYMIIAIVIIMLVQIADKWLIPKHSRYSVN